MVKSDIPTYFGIFKQNLWFHMLSKRNDIIKIACYNFFYVEYLEYLGK